LASRYVVQWPIGGSSFRKNILIMAGREDDVQRVLADPDVVRRSRQDPEVYLFYRQEKSRWLCAVVRREIASGFLITAYPTDVIKVGEIVWKRSR